MHPSPWGRDPIKRKQCEAITFPDLSHRIKCIFHTSLILRCSTAAFREFLEMMTGFHDFTQSPSGEEILPYCDSQSWES